MEDDDDDAIDHDFLFYPEYEWFLYVCILAFNLFLIGLLSASKCCSDEIQ